MGFNIPVNQILTLIPVEKRIWFIIILALLSHPLFSQKINYADIRDSVRNFSCGSLDSAQVYGSMRRLERLGTSQIGKNIDLYYNDLATCYWLASGGQSEYYLLKSIHANLAALRHKPKSTKTMWDLAFGYVHLNDCVTGKYYMDLYKKYTPKKYQGEDDIEQQNVLLAKCK